MKLRDIFHQASQFPDSWLYLPGDHKYWTLDTDGVFLDPDPDTGELILPSELASKGFREALDIQTIADCVNWADRLSGTQDDAMRLESFIYYFRFDAFLPRIGAPDPPPWEETQRKMDLEFYEKLGPEDLTRPCKREGCNRGAIRNSVMCKRHHFEMIKHRNCPFDN